MATLAVPAAVWAGSKLYSHFKNKGKVDPEKAALAEETAGAAQARTQSAELYKGALPQLQQTGNYYSTLVGGNRSALTAAMQPETRQITDAYAGASANLERAGVRGATRDLAEADIGRERAGRIAGLVPGLRANAAANLSGLATNTLAASGGRLSSSTGTYADLARGYQQDRYQQDDQHQQSGEAWGKLITGLLSAYAAKKAGA